MGRFTTGMRGPDAIRKLNELDDAVGGALVGAGEAVSQAFAYRNQAEGFAGQAQTAAAQVLEGVTAANAAAGIATAKASAAGISATAADEAEQAAGQSATAAHDDAVAAGESAVLAGQREAGAAASAGTANTARGEAIQAAADAGAAADEAESYRDTIVAAITNYGNGWTPVLGIANDGERRVLQVLDWTGGTAVKPALGYLAESGIVPTIADALNVRGAPGASGGGGTVGSVNDIGPDADGDVLLQIGDIPGLQAALAAAGQVKTVAGVAPDVAGDVPLTAEDVGADAAGTAEAEVAILADGLAPVAMSGSWDDVEDKPAVIGAGATQQAARDAIGLGGVDNVSAAALRDRSTHTGEQAQSTVTGLAADLAGKAAAEDVGAVAELTTTAKTLVGALNEVNAKPSGGGGPIPLATNFAFASLIAGGSYYGVTNSADGPEVVAGGTPYNITVAAYPTGTANGDMIVQTAWNNQGGQYSRYGFPTISTWDAWQSTNLGYSSPNIAAFTDFNSLTVPGFYRTIATGITNAPATDALLLVRVSKHAQATGVLQEVFFGNASWFRNRSAGVWSTWTRVVGAGESRFVSAIGVTGALSLDFANYDVIDLTLAGNVTLTVPYQAVPIGVEITKVLRIRAHATTAYTLTLSGVSFTSSLAYYTAGGAVIAAPAAGKAKEIVFTGQRSSSTATNWILREGAGNA